MAYFFKQIKLFYLQVQDLAFAHIPNQIVLASIDEMGNFYIHEIEVTDTGLR